MSPPHKLTERDLLLTGAGAFSAILYFALLQHPIIGGGEPVAIAESIVHHGRFADPFAAGSPSGATAHLAPLLPLFFALCYAVFGKTAAFALILFAAIAQGIHTALLPRFSERLLGRPTAGFIAAIFSIALPIFKLEPMWENMYSAAGLLLFFVVFDSLGTLRKSIKCGAALGFLLLLNPALLPIALCWLICIVQPRMPSIAAIFLAASAVLLPWEIRNYVQLGGFTFVRDNFGLELYVANNDCAQATLIENLRNGCYAQHHPMFNANELKLLQSKGELNYNRRCSRLALEWMATHGARFWRLLRDRFCTFWFPPGQARLSALLTTFSLFSIASTTRKNPRAACFSLSALLLYPLPYYLVQYSDRFRYPVLGIMLVFAAHGIFQTVRFAQKATRTRRVAFSYCNPELKN